MSKSNRTNLAKTIYKYWNGKGTLDQLKRCLQRLELDVTDWLGFADMFYNQMCLRLIKHTGNSNYADMYKRLSKSTAKRLVRILC